MIIPIRTDYRMTCRPWVNYAIIAANVLLYVMGYNGSTPAHSHQIDAWLLHPDAPTLFQFVSCTFLHASWMHLLGNMLFLWVFGNAVNDRFGQLGYLMFYMAGGVLAGVGYVVLSGLAPVLGASGAIAAVTGAYLALLPRARVTVLAFLLYVMLPFEVSSLYFLLFQVVWNIVMSMSSDVGGHAAGGVAYAAHSSGYVFGIAVAIFLLAIKALPRDPFDALNLVRTWRRRSHYRQMVAQGYDPFSFVRPQIQQPPRLPWQAAPPPPTEMDAREAQLRRDIYDALGRNDLATGAEKYLQLIQIAEDAVLTRQQQLDVANYLNTNDRFPAAADAYERFLKHYAAGCDQLGDIHLVLGLLYSRYLHQYDRAANYLQLATQTLKDPRRLELAQSDLRSLKQQKGS